MDFIVVFVTTSSEEEAEKIAKALVEEHLAGCVNILSKIKSIYFWEGKVCEDSEVLLIIKTRTEKFESLKEKITSLHSYQVPEIIALPIEKGSTTYLDWLKKVT